MFTEEARKMARRRKSQVVRNFGHRFTALREPLDCRFEAQDVGINQGGHIRVAQKQSVEVRPGEPTFCAKVSATNDWPWSCCMSAIA